MNSLIQSAKAVNDYHPFPLINIVWIALAVLGVVLLTVIARFIFQTKAVTVAQLILTVAMMVLVFVSGWNLSHPNQAKQANLIQQKQQQFVEKFLKPYVTKHTESITILGYVCGVQQKGNTYNLEKNPNQVAVTAYYKDKKHIKAISGNMTVIRKGNDKMTLRITNINQSLTKTWGAGYYEPVLTVPKNMDFTCRKVSK